MLADDAVFYSPAVFTPQEGRATTLAYLTAAAKVFADTDFHYVEKWFGEQFGDPRVRRDHRREVRQRHRHDPLERG